MRNSSIDPAGLYPVGAFIGMFSVSRAFWDKLRSEGAAPQPLVREWRRKTLYRGSDLLFWSENPSTYAERAAARSRDIGEDAQASLAAPGMCKLDVACEPKRATVRGRAQSSREFDNEGVVSTPSCTHSL